MTEPSEKPEPQDDLNRLTMPEFLTQLDVADQWGIYVNSNIEEIELVVKDGDDEAKFFHGPDPLTVPFVEYKRFCRTVEEMAETKTEQQTP